MNREERPSAAHRWPWVLGIAGVLVATAALVFWFRGPTVWIDGRGIHVADAQARLRHVLWSRPELLDARFSGDGHQQQYEPALSPDGSEFYFVRGKPGHDANIYVSYRNNNQWTAPVALDAINSPYDDLGPRLTPDGQFLLFYSDRPGGYGGYDIWAARRTATGWGKPFNLGPRINSEFNEFSPDPTPDGRHLIFATNRKSANQQQRQAWKATIRETVSADYDLWIAELDSIAGASEAGPAKSAPATEPTTAPATQPAGPEASQLVYKQAAEIPGGINTPWVEGASCMSPAGDFLYFASNRPGGYGNFDIWRSRVSVGGEGQWTFGAAENVGPQINTADNETDPAMALNGYRMYLSSDRGNDSGVYRLLLSDSREVYPIHESRRAPQFGLSAWLLLGSLLLLVPLLLFLRGWDDNRLNTLQRCLLLSLLVHVGICFALSLMKVTTQVYHYVKQETGGGGVVTVALSAPGDVEVGYAIRQQATSDLPVASVPPTEIARSQAPVEHLTAPGPMAVQAPEARASVASKDVIQIDAPTYSARTATAEALPVAASVAPPTDGLALSVAQPRAVAAPERSPRAQAPQGTDVELAKATIAAEPGRSMQSIGTQISPVSAPRANGAMVSEPVRARVDASAVSADPVALASPTNLTDVPADVGSTIGVSGAPAKRQAAEPSPASAVTGQPTTADAATPFAQSTVGQNSDRPALSAVASSAPVHESTRDRVSNVAAASHERELSRTAIAPDVPAVALHSELPGAPKVSGLASIAQPRSASRELSEPTPKLFEAGASMTQKQPEKMAAADSGSVEHAAQVDAPLPPALMQHSPTSAIAAGGIAENARANHIASNLIAGAQPIAINEMTASAPPPALSLPANLLMGAKASEPARANEAPARSPDSTLARTQSLHVSDADRESPAAHLDVSSMLAPSHIKAIDVNRASPASLPELGHQRSIASSMVAPDAAPAVSLPLPPPLVGPASAMVPDSPFKMRAPEVHRPLLESLGGTKESEGAVERALAYLASVQEEEGRWGYITGNNSRRRRGGTGRHPHDMACTGLAVLAFMAQDHRPDKAGPYQEVVTKGLDFLVTEQLPDGDLRGPMRGGGADQGNMYDQGIATFALAEAAAMSHDPRYTEAALKGSQFIVAAQDPASGGWRYIPGESGDSSVFGWQVMALHSAEQLGFRWPADTRHNAIKYIHMASSGEREMLAAYQPNQGPSAPMTAEIAFSRMLLGQQLTDGESREVGEFLGSQPPGQNEPDIYYWYYGSLCMMQMQNDAWHQWNTRTRDLLVRTQHKSGAQAGSWDGMRWGDRGGRVFTTAMATLTLEVYYRYMPMQKK